MDSLDHALCRKFHDGDLEALGLIVEAYQARTFRLGWRLFGNREAAADFAQDVFVHIYEKRGHYDPQRPFEPWFFRLAVNLGRSRLRRKREVLMEELPVIESPQKETEMEQEERRNAVLQTLDRLPRKYRETLALRFESELGLKEIAQSLGISIGGVKSRLSRGLTAFRKMYVGMGGERL